MHHWEGQRSLSFSIVNKVAEKLGKTPAQVVLRWGLQMGHSLVPKSTHQKRIQENFNIFDWSIPDDLFAKFSDIEQASVFPSCCSFLSFELLFDLVLCLFVFVYEVPLSGSLIC